MNTTIELNLALILFLPWFAILGALFWCYPRQPRGRARQLFDSIALALALAAFVWSIHWSHASADPHHGKMWPQVLATALGYGVFLGVLTLAFFVRLAWFRRICIGSSQHPPA
jgi:cyanate permease